MAVSPDIRKTLKNITKALKTRVEHFKCMAVKHRFGTTRGTYCDLFRKELLELAIKR
jgi:hypothetical protein